MTGFAPCSTARWPSLANSTIDPLVDERLPADVDALFVGGGFPFGRIFGQPSVDAAIASESYAEYDVKPRGPAVSYCSVDNLGVWHEHHVSDREAISVAQPVAQAEAGRGAAEGDGNRASGAAGSERGSVADTLGWYTGSGTGGKQQRASRPCPLNPHPLAYLTSIRFAFVSVL